MSTSGVLGKIIPLSPALIIFIRCVLAGVLLWLYIGWRSNTWHLPNDRLFFLGSGVLLAIHWTTYFISLKLGGVAVGMLSLFTYPVITSLLEPLVFKHKLNWYDVSWSIVILIGLLLIVPEFNIDNRTVQGLLWGVFSAVVYSFRNLWNKKYINHYSGSTIMCYQLLVSAVVLLPSVFIYPFEISVESWGYLAVLVIITTAIAHTLFVRGLQYFSTTSVSIMSSLIPLYGVGWALWLTDEVLTTAIIAGGAVIIAATIAQNVKYLSRQ